MVAMMNTEMALLSLLAGWALGVILLAWVYRRELMAVFREPVCAFPILIVESDDWGPGPPGHAEALLALENILTLFRDGGGRQAVMTLGLTLSVPDSQRMAQEGWGHYYPRLLSDPAFAPILDSIKRGIYAGVFSPQLHGLAHYWPPALMAASSTAPDVMAWLRQKNTPNTEALPPALQSRWTDASVLPSRAITKDAIEAAVGEETQAFQAILGQAATVAVPPTFVWNEQVELAWSRAGVECIITPGTRYESRGADGKLVGYGKRIANGDRGGGGIVYLVRDVYFEPMRNHKAERVLDGLSRKTAAGRPCLVETHRFNFIESNKDLLLQELERMFGQALERYPSLRFMSSAELARAYQLNSRDLFEHGIVKRISAWLMRLRELPRFCLLARGLGGMGVLLAMGYAGILAVQ